MKTNLRIKYVKHDTSSTKVCKSATKEDPQSIQAIFINTEEYHMGCTSLVVVSHIVLLLRFQSGWPDGVVVITPD